MKVVILDCKLSKYLKSSTVIYMLKQTKMLLLVILNPKYYDIK